MTHKLRMPAEWEPVEAVLIAWPEKHTDWNYILDQATTQYRLLIKALLRTDVKIVIVTENTALVKLQLEEDFDASRIMLAKTAHNDTWTRDFGPIAVIKHSELRLLDFGFNAWGLKFAADKDNLVNLALAHNRILNPSIYRNHRDFILEGGSIESDGAGTLLTTSRCLCSPNRNGGKTKAELNEILATRLGADHILWLDYGALEGDDTDSHVDTLARMAPDNTILFTGCRDETDPQFETLLKMRAQLELMRTAQGEAYNLIELPLPDPVHDPSDGSRLPATYANYLIVNGFILMPTYAQPAKDRLAAQTLRIVFPQHQIIGVDCRTLLRQHGSLHCATMQLPPGSLGSDVSAHSSPINLSDIN